MPELQGQLTAEGLIDAVSIERDALGVPTVRGENRADVAWATGFLHAQDRFFQMDLIAALDGRGIIRTHRSLAALDVDRDRRLHRMRQRARDIWTGLTPRGTVRLFEPIRNGVNAGLGRLNLRPFEYLILRSTPVAWLEEDTILVSFAFFFELNDYEAYRESTFARLKDGLPPAMHAFITASRFRVGCADGWCTFRSAAGAWPVSLRFARRVRAGHAFSTINGRRFLSNNRWQAAMAGPSLGGRSATGKAMIANDMHLDLRVPNIWYRMRLVVR